ncbi:MAG: ATP-dependent RNA helicase HrpA [Desulfobacteraceae bacterium]|nr:MAG: ATP-dependent RNA helicase HrpA [Desulfobacteraceae bacterium]
MNPENLFNQITKIERLLPEAMPQDRYALLREISRLRQSNPRLTADQVTIEKIRTFENRLRKSIRNRTERKSNCPQPLYDDLLPILDRKHDIIEAISRHSVVIVSGETGSGKTTQLPKFCLEAGRGIDGLIGCTQPRRIAAITVAGRIAEELGEPLGRSVGYQIRFQDRTSREHGYIKLMTDGILLAEAQTDRFLNAYDTLIIDEAHERSLNIDFLLGILRNLIKKRSDLKIIVTSATIDTQKFSKAFDDAPVIEVSGRMYPVEVRYWKKPETESENGEEQTLTDLAAGAVDTIMGQGQRGDILVFMPTEHDIRETCETLEGRKYRHTIVLPLYARLSAADQMKVFASHAGRKIVVATNVAETSITVPGIRYVVDTGVARISNYDPRTRTTTLPISPVSKSSADQRKGRCGRVADGICIRLFSEEDYENRPLFTPPEILRADLSEVILRMMALKLGDIASFPFIDPPPSRQIRDGFDSLVELGAIVSMPRKRKDAPLFHLTPRGKRMAAIPLSPRLSRILIEARSRGCLKTVAVIVSALTVGDPREKPRDAFTRAEAAHARFKDPASDFMTMVNIWTACFGNPDIGKSGVRAGELKKFCKAHFMSFKRMREWQDVHEQIFAIFQESEMDAGKDTEKEATPSPVAPTGSPDELFSDGYTAVHQSILSGFLSNIAVKKEKNIYQAAKGRQAMIFPGSGQFNKAGQWIVAAEMVETSRLFARGVATISVRWLESLGGSLCKYSYSNPRWQRNREAVVADQQVSLFGLVIVSGRTVLFGPVDPEKATEIFIGSALMEIDVRHPLPFMTHNQDLIEDVRGMENRVRRRDLLVAEVDLIEFYRKRLAGVYDMPSLKKRIRESGSDDFLRMGPSDVLSGDPDDDRLSQFPDKVEVGTEAFSCDYHFEPGQDRDGVTVRVPVNAADSIPPEFADWIIPGLLAEKITELIKGLPKSHRKQLVPVAATVSIIMDEMPKFKGSLAGALSRFIHDRLGVDIPAGEWNEDALPDYLKLRIALTDSKGKEILSSRDKGILRQSGNNDPADLKSFVEERRQWERTGLTAWDFPDLPETVLLTGRNGREIIVYPALEAEDQAVNLKLFTSKTKAQAAHLKGVGQLYNLYFSKDLKFLEKMIVLPPALEAAAWQFGGGKKLCRQLIQRVKAALFFKNIRTRKEFSDYARQLVNRILPAGQELLADILPVLETFRATQSAISQLETAQKNPVMTAFAAEVRQSLLNLMPENFIEVYDVSILRHLVRYLKTIGIRAERGRLDMEKDRKKTAAVKPFEDRFRELAAGLGPDASHEKYEAVAGFFWAIEEFKVSLFAQELKTPYPVSIKKLNALIQDISRMD